MGFLLDLCSESDENHYAEFVCVICTQLVEAPLLTSCSHVFCEGCLKQWIGSANHKCPTCSALLQQTPQPLAQASALAHRILGRIRVRCPIQDCSWKGEYSEVGSHLTNSQSHVGMGPGSINGNASGLREQAELKVDARQYKEAITLFSKCIAGHADPLALVGRGRAWEALNQPGQAQADAREALKLDVSCAPAHTLLVNALVQLGRLEDARAHLDAVPVRDEPLEALDQLVEGLLTMRTDAEAALTAGVFPKARELFATMLRHSSASFLQLDLARAELGMGMCDQTIRRTRELLRDDPNNGSAYAVRGTAYYLNGDFDQAWKHLQEALKLDPDDARTQVAAKKARKVQRAAEGAKSATFNRRFEETISLATEAIDVADPPLRSPLHAMLYAERAAAHLRLKQHDKCLEDCAKALYGSDNECKPAALTRASALHALGRHEEALQDMTAMLKVYEHDAQVKHAYHRANFEVRKMRRPDLYGLLQVPTVSSAPEIKAAFKRRALELHPDKVDMDDTEGKKFAEKRFKELGEALEILTDDFKRKLWDEGYDKEAIEERVQAAQRAARTHTSDGCCGGGGGCSR
mmetsp:Transcript_3459/g.9850  ORF Transcript_3459/g.9850 Transcript_3459/m.9850 type:complete len:580 (-) Transcript_3459:532-2271(-)